MKITKLIESERAAPVPVFKGRAVVDIPARTVNEGVRPNVIHSLGERALPIQKVVINKPKAIERLADVLARKLERVV